MALKIVNNIPNQIMKYIAIVLIAGSIGFYKGCQYGIDVGESRCERVHMAYGEMIKNHGKNESIEQILKKISEDGNHGYSK